MDILCPKGHLSTDSDYCSECGAKIQGTPSALADVQITPSAAGTVAASGDVCPDCGTVRANPTATFCEICRYNFVTGTSWSVSPVTGTAPPAVPVIQDVVPPQAAPLPVPNAPGASQSAQVASVAPIAWPPAAPLASPLPPVVDLAAPVLDTLPLASKWEATVRIDPALYTDPDPGLPCPTDEPERVYHLDFAENLIGRRSDRKDIHPELNLRDPGASHRHAKLLRLPDGSLSLLDVGSTNGTHLNGVEVAEGVKTPLKEGDEITLGFWTRITIHETRS